MKPGLSRTVSLLTAILLGALIPQAHGAAWMIRWLVTWMLFSAFLQTRISRGLIRPSHGLLLAANFLIGFSAWGAGSLLGGRDLGLAAFFCGITPTAIAAPVIMSFLGGSVSYVAGALLLTNLTIAASMPILLPFVLGKPTPEVFGQVTNNMAGLVFAPLAVAWLLRRFHPPAAGWPKRLANFNFATWVTTIFLITSKASWFLRTQSDIPLSRVVQTGLIAMVVCAVSFGLGRLLGGRDCAREASQALGQKNTAFTIYLAMAYASPLVALGPTFYVLWHNLWNSWQLHQYALQQRTEAAGKAQHSGTKDEVL